ncbi:MAG: segregation/condensation protein A [Pirellulales bacterium]
MAFQVELDVFRGPLDLLLYLVRKHEVEITDIPIAPIAEQFLLHIETLRALDVDLVGDFLDVAGSLMEIKSRMILPRADEVDEPLDDPRKELVARLLEYKKFKDAASLLDDRAREWRQRFPRTARDAAERPIDAAEEPIQAVELWDLVSAFGRILRERVNAPTSNIRYDDTPIHVYMERIHVVLRREGRVRFSAMLTADMHKSTLVAMFLAVMELVRNYRVEVVQDGLFTDFEIVAPATDAPVSVEFAEVRDYEHKRDA